MGIYITLVGVMHLSYAVNNNNNNTNTNNKTYYQHFISDDLYFFGVIF